jgi:CTP synthase (UTP-ammonia lyase)
MIDEAYTCSYELNPAFEATLTACGLRIAGRDETGAVRAVELPEHPFYVATLYQPQQASTADRPHPLITAFLQAAMRFRAGREAPG